MHRITFHSAGAELVGHLHLPAGTTREPLPAILVTGSWLTVKEQMPTVYARRLADAGYAALTFDFRGFGESGGGPREVESAAAKAEDIRNAAAFLRSDPRIDPARIGALAICASAGYLTVALADEPSIRSAVLVAPWLHDAELVRAIYGGERAVEERLARASEARARYARTGEIAYVPAASNTDSSAAMFWEGDFLDYYLSPKRGRIPAWGARFATMAWQEWLSFDPISLATRVRAPLRIVTSEGSATPAGARAYAAQLRAPHDEVWLEGSQFDFYDRDETVSAATHHALAHFEATLGASR